MSDKKIKLVYYTDMLCVWAYVAEIRLNELKNNFPGIIDIEYRFLPVFGSIQNKINSSWKDRGGFEGYAEHVKSVCDRFDHVELSDLPWLKTRPESSANAHLFIKAVQAAGVETANLEKLLWQMRLDFFVNGKDITRADTQQQLCAQLNIDYAKVAEKINSGEAMAAMIEDIELKEKYHVVGSPTYILNEGRQMLYGNVGYRVLEANVKELLDNPQPMASWC